MALPLFISLHRYRLYLCIYPIWHCLCLYLCIDLLPLFTSLYISHRLCLHLCIYPIAFVYIFVNMALPLFTSYISLPLFISLHRYRICLHLCEYGILCRYRIYLIASSLYISHRLSFTSLYISHLCRYRLHLCIYLISFVYISV